MVTYLKMSVPGKMGLNYYICTGEDPEPYSDLGTVFENHPKCRILVFQFWHFPPIRAQLKLTCLVTR